MKCKECIYYNSTKEECTINKEKTCRNYVSIFMCNQSNCNECRNKYRCDKLYEEANKEI